MLLPSTWQARQRKPQEPWVSSVKKLLSLFSVFIEALRVLVAELNAAHNLTTWLPKYRKWYWKISTFASGNRTGNTVE